MKLGRVGAWQLLLVLVAALASPSIAAPRSTLDTAGHYLALTAIAVALIGGLRGMAPTERRAGSWLVAGTLCGVVGSVLWELPFPLPDFHGLTPQDVFWLSVYPLTLRGVFLRIAVGRQARDVGRALLLDTMVVTSAALVVAWHLMIGPALVQYGATGPMVTIIAVGYPLGDVAMFGLSAFLLVAPTRRTLSDGLLVTALGLELPMDLLNALVLAHDPDVGTGWYRAGYLMINAAIAASVLAPRARLDTARGALTPSRANGWRIVVLGSALSAISVSVVFLPEHGWSRVPVAAAVVVTLAAILLRFHLAMRALESAEQALHYQATHDQLTGAANRALLLTELNAAVRESAPALIFVDLDGFKQVNDSLGHQAGDDVLSAVAQRITSVVRSGDLVARIGGDEFVVASPNVAEDDVATLARRIEQVVRQPLTVAGSTVNVGASVGVLVPGSGLRELDEIRAGRLATQLLSAADSAMYDAKRSGAGIRIVRHAPVA